MPERSPEVEHVVRDWLDAKQAGDGRAIAAALSGYDGALAIGTDAAEWWSGAGAFAEAHTAAGPFTATITDVEGHREGPVAWAAVRGTIEIDEATTLPVRLTLVLVRQGDDNWRVVQSHASVAETD